MILPAATPATGHRRVQTMIATSGAKAALASSCNPCDFVGVLEAACVFDPASTDNEHDGNRDQESDASSYRVCDVIALALPAASVKQCASHAGPSPPQPCDPVTGASYDPRASQGFCLRDQSFVLQHRGPHLNALEGQSCAQTTSPDGCASP